MKTLIVTISALFLAIGIPAQEIKTDTLSKKEARALKKQLKEAELIEQFDSLAELLNSRQFVLEANFLDNLKGRRAYVVSNLNFIKVDTTYSVIQIGSNRGIGYNGVGGVTAEGNISRWKLSSDEKKKSFYLEMSVVTNIGIYDVFMDIFVDGEASAVISGLRPGRLQYDGRIVPLDESAVYQGHTP